VGPKRRADLRRPLPGMDELARRSAAQLESAGVTERAELPPPAARTVYRITERGAGLEDSLIELCAWGMCFLRDRRQETAPTNSAAVMGLRAHFRPHEAASLEELHEVRLDDEPLTVHVHSGGLEVLSVNRAGNLGGSIP
jgi:DNA-binding HxlR family transcriptional regulator